MRYRYGFPFITAAVLAVVTIAWHQFYGGIWDFALMALISTVFTLLCGGRFRTFFAVIALTPPFLFDIGWLLLRSPVGFPHSIIRKVVGMSFFWFVALPILLVWIVTTLFNRNERNA
jgi:hypothetical protein